MNKRFTDKVIIITGASSGIGKACAFQFANEGAKVVLAARKIDELNAIAEELRKIGADVLAVKTDITIETECKNLIDQTIQKFGKIDVLVNNAGISMRALFRDLDLSVLKNLMDINFWGMVYCTRYAIQHIEKTKGTVCGVSSIAGYRGLPGRTGYSASKFAMHGFLEALRTENLKTGVNVLWVCPGYTQSNIRNTALNKEGKQQGESPFDENKLMSSEEVARRIVNAIYKRKRTIVMTPLGKITVLLNKFFPKMMDKQTYNFIRKEKDSPFK